MDNENKRFDVYFKYFDSLIQNWKLRFFALILKLVDINDINAILFLINKADEIEKLFTEEEHKENTLMRHNAFLENIGYISTRYIDNETDVDKISKYTLLHDIIRFYRYSIGLRSRIDLLRAKINIYYNYLIHGSIRGKDFNMFLYIFEYQRQIISDNKLENLILSASYSENIQVLKYFNNFYPDQFYNVRDTILTITLTWNSTNLLNYFLEDGIVSIDTLIDKANIGTFAGDKNLLNFISMYSITGRKRKRDYQLESMQKRIKTM